MIGFDNQWRDSFGIDHGARTFMGAARFVMWSKFTVFTSCGKFLFPGTLLLGFLVFAWCVEPLVFGIESAGLFENPTVSVGMVSRLPGSTVYLTYPVEDFT